MESVDIYPTLAALAGLGPPADIDGIDLSPLWQTPSAVLKSAAFSEYPRCAPLAAAWNDTSSCVHTPRANFTFMGYSVRSDVWRCTFWMPWVGEQLAANFTAGPAAVELYSHAGDTMDDYDAYENENVAKANPQVVAAHLAIAKQHWEKQL